MIADAVGRALREVAASIAGKFTPPVQEKVSRPRPPHWNDDEDGIFDGLFKEVSDALYSVALEFGNEALSSVSIDDVAVVFDLLNTDALDYAQRRAAEMIGRQLVAGQLVDNPDAQWAITDTTRAGVQRLVERAYEEGFTPSQLKKELIASYEFSPERAETIAKTETARASVQGTLVAWRRSGLVEGKSSLLSGDHDKDDECDDNADAGVIPIDETFPSGDDAPPFHPGCNCSLVAELMNQGNEEA